MSASSIAKAFWLSSANQPLIAYSNLLNAANVLSGFSASELDQANEALENDLNQRGVATDLASLTEQYPLLKASSLEFWSGPYLLQAASGEIFKLSLVNNTVQLVLDATSSMLVNVTYDKATFGAQTFTFEDSTVKTSLKFYFPSDLPENASVPPPTMADRDAPHINGQIQIKGSSPKSFAVSGKRDAFTLAGLKYEGYGDPLEVWTGRYVCRYLDGDFAYIDDIIVGSEADGSASVKLGGTAATDAMLRNNTLIFSLPSDAVVAARLICSSSGERSLSGLTLAAGAQRPLGGTADTPYAQANVAGDVLSPGASRTHTAKEAAPNFCATSSDQKLSLLSLGKVSTPEMKPIPVNYEDGSTGTIQITQSAGLYAVPPGEFIVYHQLDAKSKPLKTDASLKVGWLVSKSVDLLTMIESDYYQLRLTLGNWYCYDQKGINISLAQDDAATPGLVTLTPASQSTCAANTGGANSQVTDFTKASTLISLSGSATGKALAYRFELSGKTTAPNNADGSHMGFLSATLRFLAKDGSDKVPSRVVQIPIVLNVNLPIDIKASLMMDGSDTMPLAYPGKSYKGKLTATGGVPPYVWKTTGTPAPSGLSWDVATDDPNRATYALQGTFGTSIAEPLYSTKVSVQSNPGNAVSKVLEKPVTVAITVPPASNVQSWGGILGGSLAAGAALVGVAALAYSKMNKTKLDADTQDEYELLVRSPTTREFTRVNGSSVQDIIKTLVNNLYDNPSGALIEFQREITAAGKQFDQLVKDVNHAYTTWHDDQTPENLTAYETLKDKLEQLKAEIISLDENIRDRQAADDDAVAKEK